MRGACDEEEEDEDAAMGKGRGSGEAEGKLMGEGGGTVSEGGRGGRERGRRGTLGGVRGAEDDSGPDGIEPKIGVAMMENGFGLGQGFRISNLFRREATNLSRREGNYK